MVNDIKVAKQVAKLLLQINAIILQPKKHFVWAAGWNSPIYCDNRKTLSYPKIRSFIKKELSKIVRNHFIDVEVIAGVATAGIPHGALIAEELDLPFIYVRSSAKRHGKQNQIEGHFTKGQRVVLIEDLISSGKSSIEAAKSLRDEGMNICGIASIFTYGFNDALINFKNAEINYISLCDYETLLPEAINQNIIESDDLSILMQWRENPSIWKK